MTSIVELFRQGGFVMYPLLALSITLWSLILYRYAALHRAGDDPYELACSVIDAFELNGRSGSVDVVSNRHGRFAELVHAWLNRKNIFSVPALIHTAQEDVIPSGTLLQPFIQAAPLLGLLGTVTGMVQTFTVLSEMGAASPAALSTGIAQALITTQAGLSIALAALFGSTLVEKREKSVRHSIERAGLILARMEKGRV